MFYNAEKLSFAEDRLRKNIVLGVWNSTRIHQLSNHPRILDRLIL